MKVAENDYFSPISQSKAPLEERNLLGVKLRMRSPQNYFWTAAARVAAKS
jgi:hypothetical protein